MGHRSQSVLATLVLSTLVVLVLDRPAPSDSTGAPELGRLERHFATVLRELRQADVSGLTSAQSIARSMLIERLEDYAAARRFPHNHVVRGKYVPVFRDEHGTLCAMGFLIASTGHGDLVDDVARTANLARISELARDTRLTAWLDSTGLTIAEAARIQPSYPGDPPRGDPPPVITQTRLERRVKTSYYFGSAAAGSLSTLASVLNIFATNSDPDDARRTAVMGLVTGTAQLGLGAFVLDRPGTPMRVGLANILVGGTAVGSGVWRLRHPTQRRVADKRVSVSPVISASGIGVELAARF